MRNKILTLLTALAIFPVFAHCETNLGKIVGKEYKSIRYNIIKKACDAFDYQNDTIIEKFYKDYKAAYKELKEDSAADKKLVLCIGNIPSINGDDPKECFNKIKGYLDQVCQGCKNNNKDTSWVQGIKKQIKNFNKEWNNWYTCSQNNDFTNYKSSYTQGHFRDFIPTENASETSSPINVAEDVTESTGGTEKEKTGQQDTNIGKKKCPQCGQDKPQCTCNGNDDSSILPIILIVLVSLVGGFFYFHKKKTGMRNTVDENKSSDNPSRNEPTTGIKEEPDSKEGKKDNPSGDNPAGDPGVETLPNPDGELPLPPKSKQEWIVVGASVKGNGHIQSKMPCQDSHKFESIGNGWGIAIVSDGAGSAAHSELGSKVVVERGLIHFKNLIEKECWMKNNVLPTDVEWLQKSYYALKEIRDDVDMVSKKNNVELKSLSATCLAVIYTPIGLLAVHVGDGRMGYKSVPGEWHAMMTPHKGEEANQTIFLVSDFWSIPNYVMSGVLVPESRVVREPVKAFALMSDGCENTAWKCTKLNPETGKYYDQNMPFEGFFNPLEETLLSLQAEECQAKWYNFIESGTSGFVKEQDDKTMVYGVFVDN